MRTFSVLLLVPLFLRALETSPFEDFIAAIWPEYDHPGVLVIYTGTVDESRLPLALDLRVPDETNLVLAMGQSDTSRNLQPIPLEQTRDGKWARTHLVRPAFQIEFYFDPFGDGDRREGELTIQLNHPLQDYHFAVQRPLSAERFQISEARAETFTDDHAFTYYRVHLNGLPAGQAKSISFSYLNRDGMLSMERLQQRLTGPREGTGASGTRASASVFRYRLPTFEPLLVLGLLSLVVGYVFLRSNSRKSAKPSESGDRRFCSHCGSPVTPDDNFCSGCGKGLR